MVGKKFRDYIIVADKIKLSDNPESVIEATKWIEDFVYHTSQELCKQVMQATELSVELSNADEKISHMEET